MQIVNTWEKGTILKDKKSKSLQKLHVTNQRQACIMSGLCGLQQVAENTKDDQMKIQQS